MARWIVVSVLVVALGLAYYFANSRAFLGNHSAVFAGISPGHPGDTELIRNAMENAKVEILVVTREPVPHNRACFERGNAVNTHMNVAAKDMYSQELRFNMNLVAAVQTVWSKDTENPVLQIGSTIWDCFNDPVEPTLSRYDNHRVHRVPLGTLHIRQIEFLKKEPYTFIGSQSSADGYLYRLSFVIDQPPATRTGQGFLPTLSATCVVLPNPIRMGLSLTSSGC